LAHINDLLALRGPGKAPKEIQIDSIGGHSHGCLKGKDFLHLVRQTPGDGNDPVQAGVGFELLSFNLFLDIVIYWFLLLYLFFCLQLLVKFLLLA
jgi:hypothetical protein